MAPYSLSRSVSAIRANPSILELSIKDQLWNNDDILKEHCFGGWRC